VDITIPQPGPQADQRPGKTGAGEKKQ
jgi:hypothetical protein